MIVLSRKPSQAVEAAGTKTVFQVMKSGRSPHDAHKNSSRKDAMHQPADAGHVPIRADAKHDNSQLNNTVTSSNRKFVMHHLNQLNYRASAGGNTGKRSSIVARS